MIAPRRRLLPGSRRPLVLAPALIVVVLGAAPAAALGATASVSGGTLQYRAAPGEVNRLQISALTERSYRVRDAVPIAPGSGCASAGGGAVDCSGEISLVEVDTADGDDSATGPDAFLVPDLVVAIRGGEGADRLASGAFARADLSGGPGADALMASDGGGDLRGGDGDDLLHSGLDFSGVLDGGRGDDTFALAGARQSVTGGPGHDSATYALLSSCCTPDRVAVTLDGDRDDGPFGADDIGEDVEVVEGGSSGDSLAASARANTLLGRAGDDALSGGPGNDLLYGHDGADALRGDSGADYLDGGNGDDTLSSRDGLRDRVVCGEGTDSVSADREDLVARDCERVSRPRGPHEQRTPTPIPSPDPLAGDIPPPELPGPAMEPPGAVRP